MPFYKQEKGEEKKSFILSSVLLNLYSNFLTCQLCLFYYLLSNCICDCFWNFNVILGNNTQENNDCQSKDESKDNRALVDDNKAQSLTGEDIDAMRR